jgi:hypothetical protein
MLFFESATLYTSSCYGAHHPPRYDSFSNHAIHGSHPGSRPAAEKDLGISFTPSYLAHPDFFYAAPLTSEEAQPDNTRGTLDICRHYATEERKTAGLISRIAASRGILMASNVLQSSTL